MPFIESNNKNNKLKIYYEIYGNNKPNIIVLVHPIGDNIEIWNKENSSISKKNLRIIAYEIRGHNRSNMGTNNSFTISDLADDLKILLDILNIIKCTLI
jgi:pimeloyl-ACP methyl ester carboxylesterase